MIGRDLLHYRITAKLGEGGMGEVYRAQDSKLAREVAIKVLPGAVSGSRERLERFDREARAVAALNHPSIVTIHSVEEDAGVHFLTMELVEGQTLSEHISEGGMPLGRLLEVALQVTDALSVAHEKGIVHRDLKPGNVMVTGDGRVKVLDFGLAKLVEPTSDDEVGELPTEQALTGRAIVGTTPYLSPEQVEGRPVDHRSDIFSLGVMLYEMATGSRPFSGGSSASVMSAILKDAPPPLSDRRAGLPRQLASLVNRCLEKDPARRPADASEVREGLRTLQTESTGQPGSRRHVPILAGAAATVIVLLAFGGHLIQRNRALAFQADALPRLDQLARDRKYVEAFDLARELERVAGPGVVSAETWDSIARTVSLTSEPSEASVSVRPFGTAIEPRPLGETPLDQVRVPRGPAHWRVERDGYVEADFISIYGPDEPFVLLPESDRELDMVRVPGTEVRLWVMGGVRPRPRVEVASFLIDRHEVSNREYLEFVQAGGYERKELWTQGFQDADTELSFAEAMERFRDLTGRPGPAGWRLGRFLDGEGELPVTGVSWYEADAYARFAGKSLPTIYHWYYADTGGDLQLLPGLYLPHSNYSGDGPRAPGVDDCVTGSHGAHDMAGNVREWGANAVGSDRLLMGGSWADPSYIYMLPEARSPFDRGPENGFRCIRFHEGEESSPDALAALEPTRTRDYSAEAPIGDDMYAAFARSFDRVPVALDPRAESTDDSAEHWVKQKVSYAAGYGDERMETWLYLPRNAQPPYQVVIQMGGAGTFYRRTSETESSIFGWPYAEDLIRGGRAVLLPLWKGSYERSDGFNPHHAPASEIREHAIQWVSEMRRSVDYLQSREDIDPEGIGYQGISYGAMWAPLFLAQEPRLKAGLIIVGGLVPLQLGPDGVPPEVDPLHHAPRVKAPVLMLNGRYDPIFTYETSQLPLFRTLGTPEAHKRHAVFPAGHSTSSWRDELVRESLDWLDRYLGRP